MLRQQLEVVSLRIQVKCLIYSFSNVTSLLNKYVGCVVFCCVGRVMAVVWWVAVGPSSLPGKGFIDLSYKAGRLYMRWAMPREIRL